MQHRVSTSSRPDVPALRAVKSKQRLTQQTTVKICADTQSEYGLPYSLLPASFGYVEQVCGREGISNRSKRSGSSFFNCKIKGRIMRGLEPDQGAILNGHGFITSRTAFKPFQSELSITKKAFEEVETTCSPRGRDLF